MGRRLRYRAINTTYHCYSRCHGIDSLMEERESKLLLEEVIRECRRIYDFEMNAFQIMDNHFHFIIRTLNNAKHTISVIMKWIKSTFTRRYNKMFKRKGTFWNERFGAKVLEHASDPKEYLNTLIWYLGYNPVRKGIVKDPRKYEFGSLNNYLKDSRPSEKDDNFSFITLHKYFLNLSDDIKMRLKRFLEYEKIFKRRYKEYNSDENAQKPSFFHHLHRTFVTKEQEKAVEDSLRTQIALTRIR